MFWCLRRERKKLKLCRGTGTRWYNQPSVFTDHTTLPTHPGSVNTAQLKEQLQSIQPGLEVLGGQCQHIQNTAGCGTCCVWGLGWGGGIEESRERVE